MAYSCHELENINATRMIMRINKVKKMLLSSLLPWQYTYIQVGIKYKASLKLCQASIHEPHALKYTLYYVL